MKKTGKPIAAGILNIITGALGILGAFGYLIGFGVLSSMMSFPRMGEVPGSYRVSS